MLSAGIGCFVLGLFTTLDEASKAVDAFLAPWGPGGVGPLGGKVGLAVIAYVVSLAVLLAVWWKKDVNIKTWFWVSLVLGCLGVLMTVPRFFQIFAAEQMTSADRVYAWATATGEGLVAFMVTWLVSARLMEMVLPEPLAANTAMAVAGAIGALIVSVEGLRHSAQLRSAPTQPSP